MMNIPRPASASADWVYPFESEGNLDNFQDGLRTEEDILWVDIQLTRWSVLRIRVSDTNLFDGSKVEAIRVQKILLSRFHFLGQSVPNKDKFLDVSQIVHLRMDSLTPLNVDEVLTEVVSSLNSMGTSPKEVRCFQEFNNGPSMMGGRSMLEAGYLITDSSVRLYPDNPWRPVPVNMFSITNGRIRLIYAHMSFSVHLSVALSIHCTLWCASKCGYPIGVSVLSESCWHDR